MTAPRISCYVYKGKRRDDGYLYVVKKDEFSRVPPALMKMLGGVQFVMELELWADRRMAQVSAEEVMRQLQQHGFFLQLPREFTGAPM